MTAWQDR